MRYGEAWNYDLAQLDVKKCSSVVRQIISLISDQTLGRYLSRDNFKWYVSDGSSVFFWEDWWVGGGTLKSLMPALYANVKWKHMVVKNFVNTWRENRYNENLWIDSRNLHSQEEFKELSQLLDSVSLSASPDILIWLPGKAAYSSKECQKIFLSSNSQFGIHSFIWRSIWKIKAPPKILAFLWKVQWRILPTRQFISSRIPGVLNICPWCEKSPESISHLFWECTLADWGWNFLGKWWNISVLTHRSGLFSLSSLFNMFSQASTKEIWKIVVAAVLWSIWLARNELTFAHQKIRQKCFVNIIAIRINKWGCASGLMDFGADPLWKVNPQGAIAIRHHQILNSYWKFKRENFDYVAAVDGAWGMVDEYNYNGGIGGYVKDASGKLILMFSGPVKSSSALESEVEAIIFVINWMLSLKMLFRRLVICSDSSVAVNSLNEGISIKFPVRALNFFHQGLINSSIFVQFVPRYLNEQADELAKKGLHRFSMFQKVMGPIRPNGDLSVPSPAACSTLGDL